MTTSGGERRGLCRTRGVPLRCVSHHDGSSRVADVLDFARAECSGVVDDVEIVVDAVHSEEQRMGDEVFDLLFAGRSHCTRASSRRPSLSSSHLMHRQGTKSPVRPDGPAHQPTKVARRRRVLPMRRQIADSGDKVVASGLDRFTPSWDPHVVLTSKDNRGGSRCSAHLLRTLFIDAGSADVGRERRHRWRLR